MSKPSSVWDITACGTAHHGTDGAQQKEQTTRVELYNNRREYSTPTMSGDDKYDDTENRVAPLLYS